MLDFMERALPRHNEVWRHFKDKLYRIVTIAQHTETGEQMVVYRAMYGEQWAKIDLVREISEEVWG